MSGEDRRRAIAGRLAAPSPFRGGPPGGGVRRLPPGHRAGRRAAARGRAGPDPLHQPRLRPRGRRAGRRASSRCATATTRCQEELQLIVDAGGARGGRVRLAQGVRQGARGDGHLLPPRGGGVRAEDPQRRISAAPSKTSRAGTITTPSPPRARGCWTPSRRACARAASSSRAKNEGESVSPLSARNDGPWLVRRPRAMKTRRRRASGKKRSPAARGKNGERSGRIRLTSARSACYDSATTEIERWRSSRRAQARGKSTIACPLVRGV